MLTDLFFRGLITGFIVSLPIGPMGIMVIQRTVNRDFKSGMYAGMGVAITDSIWALIAGFSVTYIIAFLRDHQSAIQIIGAIAVFSLGLYIFNSNPVKAIRKNKIKATRPVMYLISSMAIAFSNPVMILAYIVVFASANIIFDIHHLFSPFVFVSGFLLGAMVWWVTISYVINRFRHHFNLRLLWWFNKIAGAFIMLFVVVTIVILIIRGNPAI